MHRMKSRIPPTHTLRALEAFARLGTVWAAAEELGVTRSAVSHRLAMLEEILGFQVLERSGKGIVLTPRAGRYAQDVQKSLALLTNAVEDSTHTEIDGVLRISSTPGFASMWLCNYISSFHAKYPGLQLEITSNFSLDDVSARNIDLFIAFGDGNWPKHSLKHLYDVEFLPLCSPMLLNMGGGLNTPSDVLRFPLLHLRRWDDWSRWLATNGVEFPLRSAQTTFSDLMLVQTAAIAGQGIMMGDEVTCAGALSAGQLVSPFTTRIKSTGGYYLLNDRKRKITPAMAVFVRWLEALIAGVAQSNGSRS